MSVRMVAGVMAGLSLVSAHAPVVAAGEQGGGRPASNSNGSQMGPWEWWNDAGVQKELGLSTDKVKQIDEYFQRRNRELKPLVDLLGQEKQDLDRMTQAATTDESVYSLQVFRVESLAARLRESRTMMLYRMFRSLQPAQYKKLQDILDRHYGRSGNASGPQNRGRGRE